MTGIRVGQLGSFAYVKLGPGRQLTLTIISPDTELLCDLDEI